MKKITLLFALFAIVTMEAQVTTGVINFTTGYTGKVDIDATDVTVQLIGPENLWLGMGFDVNSMTAGGDVITRDSSGFNDRQFLGIGIPPTTDTQDWTVVTDNVMSGIRNLIVTRPLAGSDATDFTFDPNATSLAFVWAHGNGTFVLGNHSQANRGIDAVALVPNLGIDDQALANSLSIFPVPATNLLTVSVDDFDLNEANLEIYSMVGQLVQNQVITDKSTIVDVSKLPTGVYILNVSSKRAFATTKIIKK